MKIIKTKFKDLVIVKKETFVDSRGYFRELYKNKILKKNFIFDAMSFSKKNVILSSLKYLQSCLKLNRC